MAVTAAAGRWLFQTPPDKVKPRCLPEVRLTSELQSKTNTLLPNLPSFQLAYIVMTCRFPASFSVRLLALPVL